MSDTNEQLIVSEIPIRKTSPRGTGFDSAIVHPNSVDCERSNYRGFSETLIRLELLCDTGFDSSVDHLHSVNSKRLNYPCPEVQERVPLNLSNFFEMEPIDNNNTKRIFMDKQIYTIFDAGAVCCALLCVVPDYECPAIVSHWNTCSSETVTAEYYKGSGVTGVSSTLR